MVTLPPRAVRQFLLPGGVSARFTTVRRRPAPPAVIWLPATLVGLLALLPLVYLVLRAASAGSSFWSHLFRHKTLDVLLNSLVLAGAVAISTVVLAVPLAWLTTRTNLPGRRLWATLGALPLVIPSYVGALALVSTLGPKGIVQGWLEPLGIERLPSIYGFWGAWLALTLFCYPYVLLSVRSALRGMDPGLEEAARSLGHGPWRTFTAATLPQLRPAMAAGALLAALYTLGDFGVVTLLRYDAFTRAIYVQYRSALDRSSAAGLALLLVIVTIGLLAIESRVRGNDVLHRLGSGAARQAKPVPLGRWKIPAILFCALVVLLSLGIPVLVLLGWFLRALRQGAAFDGIGIAALHSLTIGLWTALAATAAALPIALLAARYPGPLGSVSERIAYLGYALPGIVVALAFVSIGVRTPFHQTLALLVVACVVRFLPEAVGANRLSLLQVSPRMEEAARGLGETAVGAARRVLIPLAGPGMLAGAALVLLTTMKELPVTLLLAPTGYDTLAIDIWTAANDAAYGRAAAPALLLILLSAIPTMLLAARDRRE
ncbi:MAG: ABC transporter permease [Thermomicrobiales bacterium]